MTNPYAHLKATSAAGSFSARVDLPRLTSTMPGHGGKVLFSTLVATLGLTIYQELGCPQSLDEVEFSDHAEIDGLKVVLQKVVKDGLRPQLALGVIFAVAAFPDLDRAEVFRDTDADFSLGVWVYEGPNYWGAYRPFTRSVDT